MKELFHEELCGGDSAFSEAFFLLGRPSTCDIFAGEVDDGVAIGQILGVLEARSWVPGGFVGFPSWVTDNANDLVPKDGEEAGDT